MNSQDNLPNQAAELHPQIEETRQMLFELHTHQIELEMQNEELHRAQMELDATRLRYFDLYDQAPVGYCTLSDKGLILQANFTAAMLLGVAQGALVKQPISRFILKEDQDIYYLHRKQVIQTCKPQACELRLLKSDGTQIWVYLASTITRNGDNASELRTVLNDITERKQTEEKLRLSDHAIKAISQGVLIASADQRIISVNDAFTSITGYSKSEILGRSCRFLQGPLTDPQTIQAIRLALDNVTEFFGEILNYHKDGTTFWNELMISPVRDEHDQLTHFIGITRDISKRKQSEMSLQESEHRYRSLLQNANDVIMISDMNGNMEEVNRAGELLLGYSRDEICRMTVAQIHPSTEFNKVRQHFENYRNNNPIVAFETTLLCKDKRLVDVEVRPTLAEINGRKVVQGVFIDLTERKRLEKERLAAETAHQNVLVREVHHRIKNHLQGMVGLLGLHAFKNPDEKELIQDLAAKITSVALVYGIQGKNNQDNAYLCEITSEICKSLEDFGTERNVINYSITADYRAFLPSEYAVPIALIINELMINAIKHSSDSMPKNVVATLVITEKSAKLTIQNRCQKQLSFPGFEEGVGLGVGLSLVRAMLPKNGVRLSLTKDHDNVCAQLSLEFPILSIVSI